jgi:hypothetical protein
MGTYADSMTPIISGATINMVEQVCLLDAGFDSFGYIPKSGIAVLVFWGNSVLISIVAELIDIPTNRVLERERGSKLI